jgi:hypothetical protein
MLVGVEDVEVAGVVAWTEEGVVEEGIMFVLRVVEVNIIHIVF